jgi:hypothetical protein
LEAVTSTSFTGAPAKLSLKLVIITVLLVITTVAMLVKTDGNVIVAVAPVIGLGVLWVLARAPVNRTLIGLFALTLLAYDKGGTNPHAGAWDGPFTILGNALYPNLPIKLDGIEMVLVFCLGLMFMRWLVGSKIDNPEGLEGARPIRTALAVSSVALFIWIGWGIARGGNFQQMLWQTRQLMWAPILSAMFTYAFRTRVWHMALGGIIIAVALLHSLDGIYFFYAMVKPRQLMVEFSITHGDSMLLIGTIAMLIALFLERPTKRMALFCCCVFPVVAVGLVVNHRRLAYVSLAFCLLGIFLMMHSELRKRILRYALFAAPVLILYVTAGIAAKGESIVFYPIRSLVSVADTKNASNQTRDIENYNLLYTFGGQPIMGSGFGHEYTEVSVAYSISEVMPNYRYIAHNSVLWLLMLTGLIGFGMLWAYHLVTIFIGARTYKAATDPYDAALVLGSVCLIICYIFQSFGDMGMISWLGAFLVAAAVSVISNISTRVGGWDNHPPKKTGTPPKRRVTEEPLRAVQV